LKTWNLSYKIIFFLCFYDFLFLIYTYIYIYIYIYIYTRGLSKNSDLIVPNSIKNHYIAIKIYRFLKLKRCSVKRYNYQFFKNKIYGLLKKSFYQLIKYNFFPKYNILYIHYLTKLKHHLFPAKLSKFRNRITLSKIIESSFLKKHFKAWNLYFSVRYFKKLLIFHKVTQI